MDCKIRRKNKSGNRLKFLNSEEVTSTEKVRVVIDPLSLSDSSKEWEKRKYVIEYLKSNGVEIQTFPIVTVKDIINPMNTNSYIVESSNENKQNANNQNDYDSKIGYQLMHAKFVSVDGKKAVISGVNWSDGSFKNTDAGIFVEGKVIDDLEKNFWFLFKRSEGFFIDCR